MNSNEQQLTKKERRLQRRQSREEERRRQEQSKKNKKTVWWVIGILVVAGVVFAFVQSASKDGAPGFGSKDPFEVQPDDWIKGNPNASVTLIEYGDFQCPACGAFAPLVAQIVEEFGDEMRVVYRHYPLVRAHPNAIPAARAAEAAGRQGKFWEMHDVLFDGQRQWSNSVREKDIFVSYAQDLDLDIARFEDDYGDRELRKKIDRHQSGGNRVGVQGTPWFFLNGERISPGGYEEFVSLVKAAISSAPIAAPEQAAQEEVHEHADLAVYLDGIQLDLSQEKYQSTAEDHKHEYVHLHDGIGHIVHKHAAGVTVGDFFESLGIGFTRDCITLDTGEEFCVDADNALSFYANGEENEMYENYEIADLDRILVSFGDNDASVIGAELTSVTDEACIYSGLCPERGEAPTEECVGGLGTPCHKHN